jgi:hypothetical protein
MVLFFNVLVTNTRASANGLNRVDRLDLFKYALASFACIDRISRVIIFCQLDASYASRWNELESYIHELFAGKRIEVYPNSPSNQNEWKIALAKTGLLAETAPILYMGNDDHIFIDRNLDLINEGLDWMAAQPQDQINTVHISSWTEGISTIYGINEFKTIGRHWESDILYPDACQIVNALYFEHIFFDLDMGGAYMRRTDDVLINWYPYLGDYKFTSSRPHPRVKTIIPLREQVRHFDAYWHIDVPLDACPMLDIPPGFFQNDIKIDYCGTGGDGWYAWGPYTKDRDKKLMSDIPLFWKNRISSVRGAPEQESVANVEARNNAFVKMMTTPHTRVYQTPFARPPAVWPKNYRARPNDQHLPLEQEHLQVVLNS